MAIPAALERINKDVALTAPIAQQESTRSYFLAQTLESTKTVPVVSASLPLDTGAATAITESGVDGESGEGEEDSDESDPSAFGGVAVRSTVVGSFERDGIVYAVEPGGETVAMAAIDYAKLPAACVAEHVIVAPSMVTNDDIDYYSVTRIADHAFSGLTAEVAAQFVIPGEGEESREASVVSLKNATASDDETVGMAALVIPASITTINDNAFSGFDTLQYLMVSADNPIYSSYDGALYNADLSCLLLIPGGRQEGIRVPRVTQSISEQALSHCVSAPTLYVDPDSPVIPADDAPYKNANGESLEIFLVEDDSDTPIVGDAHWSEVASTTLVGKSSEESTILFSERTSSAATEVDLTVNPNGHALRPTYISYATDINNPYTQKQPVFSEEKTYKLTSGRYRLLYQNSLYFLHYPGFATGGFNGFAFSSGTDGWKVKGYSLTSNGEILAATTEIAGPIYLYAQWRPITYKVSFYNKAGTQELFSAKSFTYDSSNTLAGQPSTGVTPGYTAKGWAATKGQSAKDYSFGQLVKNLTITDEGEVKLYLAEAPITSRVSFNFNEGTASAGVQHSSVMADFDAPMPTISSKQPTRTGYSFGGWYDTSASSGGNQYYTAGGESARNWDKTTDTVLYARWNPNLYKITLDLQGGTWDQPGPGSDGKTFYERYGDRFWASSALAYAYGTSLTGTFKKTGYWFRGFWTEANASGEKVMGSTALPADTYFTSDAKLYAAWQANTYKVEYWNKANNEKLSEDRGFIYDAVRDLAGEPTSGISAGHTAHGWATSPNQTTATYAFGKSVSNLTDTLNGTVKLYLAETINKHRVIWNYMGGTDAATGVIKLTEAADIAYDTTIPMKHPGVKTGYTFTGWRAEGADTGLYGYAGLTDGLLTSYRMKDAAIAFTAIWRTNKYTVTWNYDGGANKGIETDVDVAFGSTINMRDPGQKAGWNFAGWLATGSVEGTFGKTDSCTMGAGNITFTAQWTQGSTYRVNLVDERFSKQKDAIWYWPERGYVTSATSSDVVAVGGKIVPDPQIAKDTHYKFLGYFDVQDQNVNDDSHRMIDANGILDTSKNLTGTESWFAHWEEVSCKVNLVAAYGEPAFEASPGTTVIDKASYKTPFANSVAGGTIAIPSRKGYTFMGYWTAPNGNLPATASEKDCDGNRWIASDGALSGADWSVRPAADGEPVLLYAAWRIDECVVTFDISTPDNTESVDADKSVLTKQIWRYGEALPATFPAPSNTPSFSRHGYSFGGWYYEELGENGATVQRFVCDAAGNRLSDVSPWDREPRELPYVTLRAAWTPYTYRLSFVPAYPKVEGVATPEEKTVELTVQYDEQLTVTIPVFEPYSFTEWVLVLDSNVGLSQHMTGTRFTPQGDLASQIATEGADPIAFRGAWSDPVKRTYTLYLGVPGNKNAPVQEETYEYAFADTIVLNDDYDPPRVDGYTFAGWVAVTGGAEAARKLITDGGPFEANATISGFGPGSNVDMHLVAKWTARPLKVVLEGLNSNDKLRDHTMQAEEEQPSTASWSDACKDANVSDPTRARSVTYTIASAKFVLPDCVRKGYDFVGWKEKGSSSSLSEVVIDPTYSASSSTRYVRTFEACFKPAEYKVVLDMQGKGDNMVRIVSYEDEFEFPYPSTTANGSVFSCWATAKKTGPSSVQRFDPLYVVPMATSVGEGGNTIEGLIDRANVVDDARTFTLYAVFHETYSVDVPIVANLAIDPYSGDMIAATNMLTPDNESEDEIYRVMALGYEPWVDENGTSAFFSDKGRVHLAIYAGLDVVDEDADDLLSKKNVRADGAVSYRTSKGDSMVARPLLIDLTSATPRLYPRSASLKADSPYYGQATLDGATDGELRYGFVPFTATSPLTVRYGLLFEGVEPTVFLHGSGAVWTLPDIDAGNASTADGLRAGWSTEHYPIAKLCYTIQRMQ